jgi:hypothetical protein
MRTVGFITTKKACGIRTANAFGAQRTAAQRGAKRVRCSRVLRALDEFEHKNFCMIRREVVPMCVDLQPVRATRLEPQERSTTVLDRGTLKVGPGKRPARAVRFARARCPLRRHELRVATDPGVLTVGNLDTRQLRAKSRIRGLGRDLSEYRGFKLTRWFSAHNGIEFTGPL